MNLLIWFNHFQIRKQLTLAWTREIRATTATAQMVSEKIRPQNTHFFIKFRENDNLALKENSTNIKGENPMRN